MFKYIKLVIIIVSFFNFIQTANANGATISAKTCENKTGQTDVQDAVDLASDGDTVIIPAGTATWTEPVVITGKGLSIIGAGIGSTNITANTGVAVYHNPFYIHDCDNKIVRISGMTMTDVDANSTPATGLIFNESNNLTFRIDHMRFTNSYKRTMYIGGASTYGVIDNCIFDKSGGGNILISGDVSSWTAAMSYGTANAVYIEDCTITCTGFVDDFLDARTGARTVIRYCTIDGVTLGNHGYGSAPRGHMHREIYNNVFKNTADVGLAWAIQFRGGTGYIYNNTFEDTHNIDIGVTNNRSCEGAAASYPQRNPCDGDDPLDGNTEPQATYHGWACLDQIGRGTNQDSYPLYEYNNKRWNAGTGEYDIDVDIELYNAGLPGWNYIADHIVENRDYYNDTQMPGYTPYTYPHPLTKPNPPSNLRIVAP